MTATMYGIRHCDTVRKARAWLAARGIVHAFYDYKTAGIDSVRLAAWADEVGWETLLNRAGTTFRALPDADKAAVDGARAIGMMTAQPSMIKRPVIEHDGGLIVGFRPDVYAAAFAAR